jgi:hypothetical protein
MGTLSKWLALSWQERILVVQVVPLLLGIRLGLRLFPLQSLVKGLSWFAAHLRGRELGLAYPERVAWAVSAAGRRVIGERRCLAQALAVLVLLERRNYPAELCFGVAKTQEGRLEAHAWVESGGQVLVGGPEDSLGRFTRLTAFDGEVNF